MAIAQEIIKQLGANKFAAMTGATHFVDLGDGLQFKFKGCKAANLAAVKLSQDNYTITFYKLKGVNCDEVKSSSGLYAEDLKTAFEAFTGLATSF